MSAALYEVDGDRCLPTELTRGPWTPDAQHGGPPSALLTQALDRFEGAQSMFLVRVTVELLRPVPLAPLSLRTRLVRPGRKVQLVEATLWHEQTEVTRAVGLRIRREDVAVPDSARAGASTLPPPSQGVFSQPPWHHQGALPAFHSHGVDHRFVAGGFDQPGAATDWIRLRVPVVADQPTSAAARVAAAADFGNGISWVLSRENGYSFINPDLTLYLHRHPTGEWVCLEATTVAEPHGIALAESRLFDERGPIGRSLQSLLLEQHGKPT